MSEAFIYAQSHDTQLETPQYSSTPTSLGTYLALIGKIPFISGSSSICPNGTTLTLENIPTVDSIIWSCGSYLYISSGQNTSSCTVSCTGEGSTWVGARLVTECGDIDLPHKTVNGMGWPTGTWTQNGTSHTLNTVNFVQSGSQVNTTVYYTPASSFDWSLQSGSGVTWSEYCTSVAANLYLTLSSSGNATFVLNTNTSSCRTINTTYTFAVGYMFSFVIAPNPASTEITVMRLDEQQAKGKAVLKPRKEKFKEKGFSPVDLSQEEYTVSLYSEKKGLLKTVKTSDENCKLDLRDLPPRTYFLHIENEYVLYQEQITIEK